MSSVENNDGSFPLKTKTLSRNFKNKNLSILFNEFNDKLFLLISNYNKVGTFILTNRSGVLNNLDFYVEKFDKNDDAMTFEHKILLGSRESINLPSIYSSFILEKIIKKNENETRPMLLGLSLDSKLLGTEVDIDLNREYLSEIESMLMELQII
ncbi:hypothetical protein HDU92_004342 [Lobulomyces angularis]|nr:hypothetical protein HDU92_004342 [Lobulomyces angularis]